MKIDRRCHLGYARASIGYGEYRHILGFDQGIEVAANDSMRPMNLNIKTFVRCKAVQMLEVSVMYVYYVWFEN